MASPSPAKRSRRARAAHLRSPSSSSHPLLEHINQWCQTRFRDHGRWISRHQISTLLICSLVITSLFYPAVGIYFWTSKGGPGVSRGDAASVWRSVSTPFMDSFASSGRKHLNSLSDLRMLWDDAKDLNAIDIRDAQAIFGGHRSSASPHISETKGLTAERPPCRTVRVEHVFVTTEDIMAGQGPRFGVLDTLILQSALKLQTAIEAEAHSSFASDASATDHSFVCVRAVTNGPTPVSSELHQVEKGCLVLSPLEYWQLSADRISADANPAQTVARSGLNRTSYGAPLSFSTTLAGRWHRFRKLPRAEYLALTYFLEDEGDENCEAKTDLNGKTLKGTQQNQDDLSTSHTSWLRLLRHVTSGQTGIVPSEQGISHELILQFSPRRHSFSWTSGHILLLTGYVIVVLYISRGLVKMRKVHSRFGLAFSGLTELIISMIMSISICALLGIRLTLVPWELLPFVIVVVGSENMFVLTNAIVSTPLSLTVPARIAHGLSKAGGPIMMTTLADIILLSVISLFIGVRAVREFCIFAIMSLVMDFFLQMTFFITILSIDMQRLELADLLTQGARSSQAQRKKEIAESADTSRDGKAQSSDASNGIVRASFKAIWKARTARTASLTLILAFMGGLYLYYGTGYPSQQQGPFILEPSLSPSNGGSTVGVGVAGGAVPTFDPYAHLGTGGPPAPWWMSSPSADLWQSLNPQGARQLRIIVEPWTIVSLCSLGHDNKSLPGNSQSFAGWALFRPRIRAIIWFSKLVILPISGTTVLLWMLLLYLLKDTELLDAQRDKSEAEDDEPRRVGGQGDDEAQADVTLFPDFHRADVELIAESEGAVVSVDTEGSIRVWRLPGETTDATVEQQELQESTKLESIRINRESDLSPITALAVSAKSGLIVAGLASGRVCFISLITLKLIQEGKPKESSSAVQLVSLRHREAFQKLETVCATSVHRDGSAYEWSPAKSGAIEIVAARNDRSWFAFRVDLGAFGDEKGVSGSPFSLFQRSPVLAFAASDGSLEVMQQSAFHSPLQTIFELLESERGYYRSAAICGLPRRVPAGSAASEDDGMILLLGQSNGVIRAWDLGSRDVVCSLELGDGPVSKIRAAQDDDQLSCIIVASTNSRASLLILGSDPLSNLGLEPSGSVNGSLNGLSGGSPLKLRTPNGTHLNSANFWSDGSAPTTPTSEMPNPPAYPISSHGNAARLRRTSGHGRDRSGMASESSLSGGSATLPLPGNQSDLFGPDECQLRLVGSIASDRGGFELAYQSKSLMGVRRRRKSPAVSGLLSRRRERNGLDGSDSKEAPSSRWEMWALDLRSELMIGRNGELIVPRRPLELEGQAMMEPSSSEPGKLRFASVDASNGNTLQGLAFSRLHPVCGAFDVDSESSALLFGYGGSIGCVSAKIGTVTARLDGRGLNAQRRSKSSGGSIASTAGSSVAGGVLRR